jgi:hypothetical protein
MSRRSVFAAIALLTLGVPALAQVSVTNANSYELDNGIESFAIFVATTTPTPGVEVAGDGIVNGSPNDQMFWQVLPKEYLFSSNGTAPGTMELVSFEVGLEHSFFGVGGGGTPPVLWDMTFHPVTYTNPISGAANDGRRYPNLAAAPILTILGGPLALPVPTGCAAPQYWIYFLAFELGTATPGSGVQVPADGVNEIAWCFWQPAGMSALPADPNACEVGGNLSMMSMFSTNERVPAGITTGAATPAPTGVNRNPYHGFRTSATNFNNTSNAQGFEAWPGFREPVLQFRFFSTTTLPNAMAGPERGSGALIQDGTGLVTVNPGMRTCASGHLGDLVIHVLTADPVNNPPLAQPGIPVTPTSNLLLNPTDPNFFLLTPILDGFLGSNITDYNFAEKHTYDTPLSFALAGPIAPPGIRYYVQSFIVNIAGGPPFSVLSSNAALGTLY